jgi:conjugal transfer ATP-binding protein TraC
MKLLSKKKKSTEKNNKVEQVNIDSPFLKSVKRLNDVIMFNSFDDTNPDHVIVNNANNIYAKTLYVSELPRNALFINTFTSLINQHSTNVSIVIRPYKEANAITELESDVSTIATERYEAQEKGYTSEERRMSSLEEDARNFIEEIDSGENKLFSVSILVTVYAGTVRDLDIRVDEIRSLCRGKRIVLSLPLYVQKKAFLSNMAFNTDKMGMYHMMDKYSLSTIFPFTSSTAGHEDGTLIGYNINTHEPVFYDIFNRRMNGYNMVVVGMTRSGKSTFIKSLFLRTKGSDDGPKAKMIFSIDIENEYGRQAEAINGIDLIISKDNKYIINILEITEESITDPKTGLEYMTLDLDSKIEDATRDILTLLRGANPDSSEVKADVVTIIIKNALKQVYRDFGIVHGDVESVYELNENNIKVKKKLPTLSDLYKILESQYDMYSEKTYFHQYELVILLLEDYCRCKNGNRLYFDGQSTIPIKKGEYIPHINFNLYRLNDKTERPVVQIILLNWMWEYFFKVNSDNPAKARPMLFLNDEAQETLKFKEAREHTINYYRRAGKRYVAIITATQKIDEYTKHEGAEAIFTNATTKIVLKHDKNEYEALQKLLRLTAKEIEAVLKAEKGEILYLSTGERAFLKHERFPSEIPVLETDLSVVQELNRNKADSINMILRNAGLEENIC